MSIQYRVIQKRNPQDPEGPKKYYINAKSRGTISLEQLLKAVSDAMTVEPDEVRLAVNRTFEKTMEFLEMGFTVSYGDLGYFAVKVSCDGADTEEKATPDKVSNKRAVFFPGTAMRTRISAAKMEKMYEPKSGTSGQGTGGGQKGASPRPGEDTRNRSARSMNSIEPIDEVDRLDQTS